MYFSSGAFPEQFFNINLMKMSPGCMDKLAGVVGVTVTDNGGSCEMFVSASERLDLFYISIVWA